VAAVRKEVRGEADAQAALHESVGLLGSVPTQVSQLATCDVLIVQTTPEATAATEPPVPA
jgi:nucleotide-binding universal stress UspA family protein